MEYLDANQLLLKLVMRTKLTENATLLAHITLETWSSWMPKTYAPSPTEKVRLENR